MRMTRDRSRDRTSAEAPRLFVDAALAPGASIPCTPEQANYLGNVLRLGAGEGVHDFNGRDGEWRATIAGQGRRGLSLSVDGCLRPQEGGPDLVYLFAPLKRARLDYMVQKATELGVAALQPVHTARTVAERVNLERMRANALEAAEQCGILRIPDVRAVQPLRAALEGWNPGRTVVFCDEGDAVGDGGPLARLARLAPGPLAVLIGPEGGFDPVERAMLLARPFVVRLSLGPRIMRADTAAVAALTLVNAALGDWR
jgi:16S rRNA (uracil1498-N3)-methyltransferase